MRSLELLLPKKDKYVPLVANKRTRKRTEYETGPLLDTTRSKSDNFVWGGVLQAGKIGHWRKRRFVDAPKDVTHSN